MVGNISWRSSQQMNLDEDLIHWEIYTQSGLLINQKMGSGRESCAAKATFAPQALQSNGAEALD